jgi:hypothetical protein
VTSAAASTERCPALVGFGVALTSLALMHTQIVLTRIFSVVVWYHFAFFAISIALLGLSASALAVHAGQARLIGAHTPKLLALCALAFAASILGLALLILRVTPDWFGVGGAQFVTSFTPKLLVLFAATATPFFIGGLALSLTLARWPSAIHRNYACDLAGAAAACAIVIPVLDRLGGPDALVASCAFAALAAPMFAAASGKRRSALTFVAVGLLIVAAGSGAAALGAFRLRVAKGLELTQQPPEYNRWNSFSLVSVFPSRKFRGWGLSPKYQAPLPPDKGLIIDMNAFTPMIGFSGDFRTVQHTRYDLSALAFRLQSKPRRVCIIGAGGGKDVLAALAAGAKRVAAVEVNPLIALDVMRDKYRDFTGGLYDRKDVELHVEDGRSYLRRTRERYDVVLISMVDTSAATAAGAYSLAENSLYTVDAFEDFFARLTPGGMLTVASVSLDGLAVGARLASLARAALRATRADPGRSVAVVATDWLGVPGATMYNLLIKPAGFSSQDSATLAAESGALGFRLIYLPGHPEPDISPEQAAIVQTLSERDDVALKRAQDSWPLDVSPVDDDRPYFFYQNRWRDAWQALTASGASHLFGNGLIVLLKVLVAALIMVALCIAAPLIWMARGRTSALREHSAALAYVSCLGLGYMFLELGSIQRLMGYLGTPTHALTAVLLVLLLAGGAGSRAFAGASPRAVRRALFGLVAYAVLLLLTWKSIAGFTAGLGIGARAGIAACSLLPLGFLMGVPLPSGLAAVRGSDTGLLPWLWGVNGAASVLGSVLATLGSMHAGISALLLAGIALYLVAAFLWPRVTAAP